MCVCVCGYQGIRLEFIFIPLYKGYGSGFQLQLIHFSVCITFYHYIFPKFIPQEPQNKNVLYFKVWDWMAVSVCLTEISQPLFDGLPWNLVHISMVPQG